MEKSVFGKIGAAVLAFTIAFSVLFVPSAVLSAPVVQAPTKVYAYDPNFSTRHPVYWQAGPNPRPATNLPDGYWYPNVNFDSAWFGQNYAYIGTDGKAHLKAVSTYDLVWGGRGWSNSFVHQGRVPYANGAYEGHFKAGNSSGTAIPVDGIRYPLNTQEPTGQNVLLVNVKLLKDDLNRWFSNNGLLVALLFQYEYQNGALSLYDSPPFTNNYQSLHVDIFLHRPYKFANVRLVWSPGWYNTLGDAYNGDLHLQYVLNGELQVGQNCSFIIDLGQVVNGIKERLPGLCSIYSLPQPTAIILRYIQISAETIGGDIEADVDFVLTLGS